MHAQVPPNVNSIYTSPQHNRYLHNNPAVYFPIGQPTNQMAYIPPPQPPPPNMNNNTANVNTNQTPPQPPYITSYTSATGVNNTVSMGTINPVVNAENRLQNVIGGGNPQSSSSNQMTTFSPGVLPPPDLLMNGFEFERAMRRYSSAKEKDDDFFEEETKFLKGLNEKRLR